MAYMPEGGNCDSNAPLQRLPVALTKNYMEKNNGYFHHFNFHLSLLQA